MNLLPVARAHETYVLPPAQVQVDRLITIPSPLSALNDSGSAILFIAFILLILAVLLISWKLSKSRVAKSFNHLLGKAKPYAAPFLRVLLAAAVIIGAFQRSIFGPELVLTFLPWQQILLPLLVFCGMLLLFNLWTRYVSIIIFLVYLLLLLRNPFDAIVYLDYVAALLFFFLMGSQSRDKLAEWGDKYGWIILRTGLALGLILPAIAVKFLNTQLSMDVLTQYGLARNFGLEPMFIILSACLVEILLGLAYLTGKYLRLSTFVLIITLTASLIFFREVLWPHLILYALSISVLIMNRRGYNKVEVEYVKNSHEF